MPRWSDVAFDYDAGSIRKGPLTRPLKTGCWVMDYHESKRALEQNKEEVRLREIARQR